MFYIYYNSSTGKIITTADGIPISNPSNPYIILTNEEYIEAIKTPFNTVNLETLTLCYVDYRTPEEIEADRIASLVPTYDFQQQTLREMETLKLLVEIGQIQVSYSEPWLKRYTILMASSLITIDKVPELLQTEVQKRYDHWFD